MIMVTGAAGFIGGQTMLCLQDQGHSVIGIDTVASPVHLRNVGDRFYQEDFSKDAGLALLDKFEPDAIIHCAGSSLVGPSINRPADYYHNNFVKTKIMLDRLLERKMTTRVIFSSSAACYGEPIMVPCTEIDPCDPISPYGQSKLMIEWMLESYQRAHNLDYVAFRYFNACGADSQGRHGQRTGATHIIARVLESLRDDREFMLYGDDFPTPDGTCVRDYVHVQDIAQAHILATDRKIDTGVYNLGNNKGISNLEIIQAAQSITGRHLKCTTGARRAGDPAVLTASSAKFSVAAAWRAQYGLEDMIRHAWTWYQR